MLFYSGDLHGSIDIIRFHPDTWPTGQLLTRDDYLVILGDFGLDINFNQDEKPKWFLWLDKQPWTTLFVDGNHDDFEWLSKLPIEDKFNGKVGRASENIFHLRRGEVYNIGWSTFFVMGGAHSIDKQLRTFGIDWWPQEIPSYSEWNYAIDNLEKVNYTVDNVLAHTMPSDIAKIYLSQNRTSWGTSLREKDSEVEKAFQEVILQGLLKFNNWYCGHWHPYQKWDYEKYHCYYNHIEPIHICPQDIYHGYE